MNNRLCNSSTGKKDSVLQTKHIRKFKFRGNDSNELKGHTLEGYVNNSVVSQPEKNRKRKMISGSEYSARSKIAKMGLSEDIQHQIDDQIRMREGAMKLMSACTTLNQALETSKNLLTINGRILGLMSALQKKKQETVLQEYNRQRSSVASESVEDACTGRIAISDMRIPLMWKDNTHFTGKTGDQSYYAFALIRCGDQIKDTPLYEITSADTDMYFDLTLIFDDLHPDFKMDFEVYYTVITSNEAHGVRAPMRTTMKLHAQKRVVHFNAPKFCLAGHVHITIDDMKPGIISKDLTMGGQGASGVAVLGDIHEFPIHPLELWGQICFQLAAQPKDMFADVHKGHIDIEINSPANRYYCILRQDYLHCWENKEHVLSSKPVHSIKIEQNMKITQVQHSEVSSIKLLSRETESVIATFTFDSSTECYDWKLAIRKQIANVASWKNAFKEKMHIEETKKSRLSVPSTASFYDQIQIEEITNVTHAKQSPLIGHGIVNEAFNTVPTNNDQSQLKNNHVEESAEIAKKKSYEKTCVNTSGVAPTSNLVTASNQTDQDQAPSTPSALLLQNGLPPSGLQKAEISEELNEDDKLTKNTEIEEKTNANVGEICITKAELDTKVKEDVENVEKKEDIKQEEQKSKNIHKEINTDLIEQNGIEGSEDNDSKLVTEFEESSTQNDNLNIIENEEQSETEKDNQNCNAQEIVDKSSDEDKKLIEDIDEEGESGNVTRNPGSVVEVEESKAPVCKDDTTSENNEEKKEFTGITNENNVSADDINESIPSDDAAQNNESKDIVEENKKSAENLNKNAASEDTVGDSESKVIEEEKEKAIENLNESTPSENTVGDTETVEENKKSAGDINENTLSDNTVGDTEPKKTVEESKKLADNVNENVPSESAVENSESKEIEEENKKVTEDVNESTPSENTVGDTETVEENKKSAGDINENTLSDNTVGDTEPKKTVEESKKLADNVNDNIPSENTVENSESKEIVEEKKQSADDVDDDVLKSEECELTTEEKKTFPAESEQEQIKDKIEDLKDAVSNDGNDDKAMPDEAATAVTDEAATAVTEKKD